MLPPSSARLNLNLSLIRTDIARRVDLTTALTASGDRDDARIYLANTPRSHVLKHVGRTQRHTAARHGVVNRRDQQSGRYREGGRPEAFSP